MVKAARSAPGLYAPSDISRSIARRSSDWASIGNTAKIGAVFEIHHRRNSRGKTYAEGKRLSRTRGGYNKPGRAAREHLVLFAPSRVDVEDGEEDCDDREEHRTRAVLEWVADH